MNVGSSPRDCDGALLPKEEYDLLLPKDDNDRCRQENVVGLIRDRMANMMAVNRIDGF